MIVCTYNRSADLFNALEGLSDQILDRDAYEVIIVDNNSADGTHKVAQESIKKNGNFRYVFEGIQGLSQARNRGWLEAQGDYIAYTDDDCKLPRDWLSTARDIIQTVAPPVFGGPYYPFYKNPQPKWFKDEYGSHTEGEQSRFLKKDEFLSAGNLFLKRDLLNEISGFNTQYGMSGNRLRLGEETELVVRIRERLGDESIYYDPSLYVYHLVAPSKFDIAYHLKRQFEAGRSCYQMFDYLLDESYWIKEVLKVSLSLGFKSTLGYLFRNREKYPYSQNYIYEVTGRTIGGLGRVYEHYGQKLFIKHRDTQ